MARLYTLGSSLTRHFWPTWANILGRSYSEFENWGHAGIGNRALVERLNELLIHKDPGPDDVVIVQWATPHRFDLHKKDSPEHQGWIPKGDVRKLYLSSDAWLKEYWNEYSYVMHTANFISMAKSLLEQQECKWIFLSADDLRQDIAKFSEFSKYLEVYDSIDWAPPIYDWFNNSGLPKKELIQKVGLVTSKSVVDEHPTPLAHYQYVDLYLKDKLNIQLDKSWAEQAEAVLNTATHYKDIRQLYINQMNWDCYNCVKGL